MALAGAQPGTEIGALSASAWSPAGDADGDVRDGAHVAELDRRAAPAGMRIVVRRERAGLAELTDEWIKRSRYMSIEILGVPRFTLCR
jgi:hypothetical protein